MKRKAIVIMVSSFVGFGMLAWIGYAVNWQAAVALYIFAFCQNTIRNNKF